MLWAVLHPELVILVLVVAVVALAVIARWIEVPYPILLVLGGLGLGFVPGMPDVTLEPDVVLLVFLPALLYGAAFFTSLRELRENVGSIALLSVGAVAVTMVAVAVVAHVVIGLDWDVAFVLGAVVSPTDAVAPASVLRGLNAPRRLVSIVEGENLTNDWTALVLYRFAVAAVVTGAFSLAEASLLFVATGLGGLVVGLVAGRLIREVRRRIEDPPTEIAISLISGYVAYLPAELLGLSGVIATVTVGIYMGWYTPEVTTPLVRIQGTSVWEILRFVLEAVLCLLVGLQMPRVIEAADAYSAGQLIGWALLVSAVVVVVRLAWVFAVERRRSRGERLVIGWSGMRGAVSLAAALAIPLETDAGSAFPDRELLIFLAFSVIVVTLVGQGLTLRAVINRSRVCEGGEEEREEVSARREGAEAQLARLEELADAEWVNPDTVERLRALLRYRRRGFDARLDGGDEGLFAQRAAYQRLMVELIDAERARLLELRNRGVISEEVRRRIERDLDYEQSRIED
jgi:Na+/H+ antiporter